MREIKRPDTAQIFYKTISIVSAFCGRNNFSVDTRLTHGQEGIHDWDCDLISISRTAPVEDLTESGDVW